MAKLSLRDPARAAHLAPYHIKPYTDAERAESAARRAARAAAERAVFGDRVGDRSPSESELAYSRSDKCDVVGGESLRLTSPHMGIGTTHIDEGNIGSTNASGMLRDDVRGEGLEAYHVNSVNPVTPNPHSRGIGTNHRAGGARPTLTRLRELLSYDPSTGRICWRVSPARRVAVGEEAGTLNVAGYRRIRVGDTRPLSHHVAWALHYGEWPALEIDHINGIRDDNRIANLRLATCGQNRVNSVSANRHGVKGVFLGRDGRWGARIVYRGEARWLGTFATRDDAAAAFALAHRELHGEFSFTGGERPALLQPAVGGRPASTGALLARRSCAVCTYDFYPRATPSRPNGYSYCVSCHNDLNLRYKRGRQALLRQLRRDYLISRGDLAPDAGVGGAAGSSPDLAVLPAYRG